jgi:hypothetical protein
MTYRHRVLELLAACPDGMTLGTMFAHGFGRRLLAGLIREGFVSAQAKRVGPGDRQVEVTRLRITETGRKALP